MDRGVPERQLCIEWNITQHANEGTIAIGSSIYTNLERKARLKIIHAI